MSARTVALLILVSFPLLAAGQSAGPSVEERLRRLEQRQEETDRQIREKDARIQELERQLQTAGQPAVAAPTPAPGEPAVVSPAAVAAAPTASLPSAEAPATVPAKPDKWGAFEPGRGFVLARTELGEVDFGVFSYVRYLNQKGLDETFTDSFGRTQDIDRRSDVQLQKVNLTFKGWLLDPDFRYKFYVWTSNSNQGQGAQVVVAGNLNYVFNENLTLGAGIDALPTTRTTNGTFPNWLKVDHRTMADEYFRGSYTSGIWANGEVTDKVKYRVMVGNNLSQLGVDAAQLDNSFNTVSGALWWLPTTGEFGPGEGFGDFEHHEEVATLFGVHYTRSREDKQSQPDSEDPENSQIRVSDGTGIFGIGALAPGTQINKATYQMTDVNAGVKYRGFSLDAEYYWRQVDDFAVSGPGLLPISNLDDHGFQIQASAMLVPKSIQAYLAGSKIYGEYGDPSDISVGLNWFPYRNRIVRVNGQVLYLNDSPVGYTSVPFPLGGNGTVWSTDIMLAF